MVAAGRGAVPFMGWKRVGRGYQKLAELELSVERSHWSRTTAVCQGLQSLHKWAWEGGGKEAAVGGSSFPEVLTPLPLWSLANACPWPNLMEAREQVSWSDVIHRVLPPRGQNGAEWSMHVPILTGNTQPNELPCVERAMLWTSVLWWLDPFRGQWKEGTDWMTLICLYSHISRHVSSPDSVMLALMFFGNHMFRALRNSKATLNCILNQGIDSEMLAGVVELWETVIEEAFCLRYRMNRGMLPLFCGSHWLSNVWSNNYMVLEGKDKWNNNRRYHPSPHNWWYSHVSVTAYKISWNNELRLICMCVSWWIGKSLPSGSFFHKLGEQSVGFRRG